MLALYGASFLAIVAAWLLYGRSALHEVLFAFLFTAVTLEIGHIFLTYIIVLSDRELRSLYPWTLLVAMNLALFYAFDRYTIAERSDTGVYFFCGFNVIRTLHDTQQGMGVARLMAVKQGILDPKIPALLRRYIRWVQGIALCGVVFLSFDTAEVPRTLFSIATFLLISFLFVRMARAFSRLALPENTPRPVMLLGRYAFFGLAGLTPSRRFLSDACTGWSTSSFSGSSLLVTGFLFAAMAQTFQALRSLHRMDWFDPPELSHTNYSTIGSLALAFGITHIFQDWWLFSYNQTAARQMRERTGASAEAPAP